MKCEEALLLLSGHIDGQNTPAEERALQAHLAVCASCRARLEDFVRIDGGLADLEEDPPAQLAGAVMGRVHAEAELVNSRKKRRFLFRRTVMVAAAAAILLLLVSTGKIPGLRMGSANSANDEAVTQSALMAAPEDQSEDAGQGEAAAPSAEAKSAARAENFATSDASQETAGETAAQDGDDGELFLETAAQGSADGETSGDTTAAQSGAGGGVSGGDTAGQKNVGASDDTVGQNGAGEEAEQPQITVAPQIEAQSVPLYEQPGIIRLLIYDDDKASALTAIRELSSMERLQSENNGPTWYVTDVKTAKAIVRDYGDTYDMKLDDAAQDADADAACIIRVVEP